MITSLETKECWVCHTNNFKDAQRCINCGTIFGAHGLNQTTSLETIALKQAWAGQQLQCDLARQLNKPKESCETCYWQYRSCWKRPEVCVK